MRDWPEPDQDTSLDILETWDLGDMKKRGQKVTMRKLQDWKKMKRILRKMTIHTADWEPPDTCHCCDSKYCQSMANEALGRHEEDMYAYTQKMIDKHLEEFDTAKLNADAANARADILQAETNIARINANIALFKSQIAYNNYLSVEGPSNYTDAKNQLVNAEANLVEAKLF